jgi:hypothetical protein
MGVPVRHQRCFPERLVTALNWFVWRFLMSWAKRDVKWPSQYDAMIRVPSSKTILNQLMLAKALWPRENSVATVA